MGGTQPPPRNDYRSLTINGARRLYPPAGAPSGILAFTAGLPAPVGESVFPATLKLVDKHPAPFSDYLFLLHREGGGLSPSWRLPVYSLHGHQNKTKILLLLRGSDFHAVPLWVLLGPVMFCWDQLRAPPASTVHFSLPTMQFANSNTFYTEFSAKLNC